MVHALGCPVRDQRRTPWLGLDQLALDAHLVEQLRHPFRRCPLTRTWLGPEVGGVDPDELPADFHDLGLGTVGSSHPAILTHRCLRTKDRLR